MSAVTIREIEEQLHQLTDQQLSTVYDFVAFLADRQSAGGALETMIASEPLLARDWNRPEEDEAWSDL